MRESVGVKGVADIRVPMLKQYALLFSRIAVPGVHHIKVSEIAAELEWLQEQGIVFEPSYSDLTSLGNNREFEYLLKSEMEQAWKLSPQLLAATMSDQSAEVRRLLTLMEDAIVRTVSVDLRLAQQVEACPLLTNDTLSPEGLQNNKTGVIQIILKSLPTPDDLTSWEQIIEYRNDPASYHRFMDLRNWMSEVARGDLAPFEVEEKLEHLMSQYQRHMKLHKMKINQGVLQTILVSSAELTENLVKFKWGQIARDLFSVKQRKTALMEGELTSPGSEVAYIVKTRETFS